MSGRINRVLGLTLALDASKFGAGISQAVRGLSGFEHAASKTAGRLQRSLGHSLSSQLPRQIQKLRLDIRKEALAISSDMKRINMSLLGNRNDRLAVGQQLADLRRASRLRTQAHNDRVRQAKQEHALAMRNNALEARAERHAIRTKLSELGSKSDIVRQHMGRSRRDAVAHGLRQLTSRREAFDIQRQLEGLQAQHVSKIGASSQRVRELREQNERNKLNRLSAISKLKSTVLTRKRAHSDAVNNTSLYNTDPTQYSFNVQDAAAKLKDSRNKLAGELDKHRKQSIVERNDLFTATHGTGKVSGLEGQITDLQNKLRTAKTNIVANDFDNRSRRLHSESDLLTRLSATDLANKPLIDDIQNSRKRLLELEGDRLNKLRNAPTGSFTYGMSDTELAQYNKLHASMRTKLVERNRLEGLRNTQLKRSLNLNNERRRLADLDTDLMDHNIDKGKWLETGEIIGRMATHAMVTGFGLVFSADYFRRNVINPAMQQFAELETEFTRFRSISNDPNEKKGTDQYKQTQRLITTQSLGSGFSEVETTRALSNLISAGIDNDVSKGMLPSLINVVQASYGEIDPAAAGKIMATVFQKFNIGMETSNASIKEQAAYIADWVFVLKQASKLEFSEVAGFLDSLQTAPAILKMDTSQVGTLGTALMRLGASPRNAAQNINALSPNIARMIRSLDPAIPNGSLGKLIVEQNKLGYNLSEKDFYNEDGTFVGGWQFMKRVYEGYQNAKKTQGEGRAEMGVYNLFQTARGQNMLRAIEATRIKDPVSGKELKGWEALEQLKSQMDVSKGMNQGIAARAATEFRLSPEGLALAFDNLNKVIDGAVGTAIYDMFGSMLFRVVEALVELARWVKQHKDVAKFIASLSLAFFALATSLGLFLIVAGGSLFILGEILAIVEGLVALGLGASVIAAAPFILAAVIALGGLLAGLATVVGLVATAFGGTSIIDMFNKKLEQAKLLFEGLAEMWSDYTTPEELFLRIRNAGVWPLLRAILMIKYRSEQFWDGLVEGTESARSQLKAMTLELSNTLAKAFGTNGLEFTDPTSWKAAGKILGTILSALYLGATLFLFTVNLIVRAFQDMSTVLEGNKFLFQAIAFIVGVTLFGGLMAILFIMGVLTIMSLTMGIAWMALLVPVLLIYKYWKLITGFLSGEYKVNYNSGILGAVSWLLNMLQGIITIIQNIGMLFQGMGLQIIGDVVGSSSLSDMGRVMVNMANYGIDSGKNQVASNYAISDSGVTSDNMPFLYKNYGNLDTARVGQIYNSRQAMSDMTLNKTVTIQKVEVIAPEGSDPDKWAEEFSNHINRRLMLDAE